MCKLFAGIVYYYSFAKQFLLTKWIEYLNRRSLLTSLNIILKKCPLIKTDKDDVLYFSKKFLLDSIISLIEFFQNTNSTLCSLMILGLRSGFLSVSLVSLKLFQAEHFYLTKRNVYNKYDLHAFSKSKHFSISVAKCGFCPKSHWNWSCAVVCSLGTDMRFLFLIRRSHKLEKLLHTQKKTFRLFI